MEPKRQTARRFLRARSGAVAIEYCLIAGAMAVMLVAAFPSLTEGVTAVFGRITAALQM
jgi:Flp pilus assembly pilin Flp